MERCGNYADYYANYGICFFGTRFRELSIMCVLMEQRHVMSRCLEEGGCETNNTTGSVFCDAECG